MGRLSAFRVIYSVLCHVSVDSILGCLPVTHPTQSGFRRGIPGFLTSRLGISSLNRVNLFEIVWGKGVSLDVSCW